MIKNILFSWKPGGELIIEKGDYDFIPDLVMFFSDMSVLKKNDVYGVIKDKFPGKAPIVGCSTSMPILADDVFEGFVTGIALKFEKTEVKAVRTACLKHEDSANAAEELAKQLRGDNLCHVFVVSDGMHVNGSVLTEKLNDYLGGNVSVSGGMACDGANFSKTLTGLDCVPKEHEVIAVGFYGKSLKVGTAAQGGWDPFGIDRIVTRSEGNILYELDGKNALDLYIEYLGDAAKGFPASALLYPLSIRKERDSADRIIRTFDKVNEDTKSLRFSGDIPTGYYVQFMKGEIGRLAEGAAIAARDALAGIVPDKNTVAFAVSCLGRQIAMGQRVSEELEAVISVLGEDVSLTGFYSHGEFCPLHDGERSVLHNQTMALTVLKEE